MASNPQQNPQETSLVAYATHNIKMLVGIVVVVSSVLIGAAVGLVTVYQAVVWMGT